MAVERLEIQLEAKADKFKQDINNAKIKLNELQLAAIKAGGGSDKLAKQIKVQRNEVKRLRLSYETATLELKRHASQAVKTSGATQKLTSAQKRTRTGLTQLSYAIDDVQYGFQGVMNNIQAMAVSFGLSGGLVFAVTIATTAIGQFIKHLKETQKEAKEAQKALSEKQGLMASMMTYAEVVKNSAEGTKEHEDALKSLRDNGFDGNIAKIDEYIEKLGDQMVMEAQVAASQKTIQDALVNRIKAQDDIKKLEEGGMTKDKAYKKDNRGNFKHGALAAQYRDAEEIITKSNEKIDESVERAGELQKKIMGTDVKGDSQYVKKMQDLKEEMAEVDQMVEDILTKGQPLLDQEVVDVGYNLFNKGGQFEDVGEQDAPFIDLDSIDLDDDTQRYLDNLKLMIQETNTLRDNVGGAFTDLGGIIATNLGRNGDSLSAFLGAAIGTYTKLLATNKAFLAAIIPIKATEAGVNATVSATETASKIPFGAFVLPALIAGGLAAVSSAFSSVGASGGGMSGGGGGGRPSTSVNSVASPNPVRESARSRGSDIIIPVDQIRYGLQVGESNYGSSS